MEQVRLAELCASTSLFTDLGSGQPVEHGLRSSLVAMRLAAALGTDQATSRDVFYTSMLRFLGCTAASHGLAELGNGDERHVLSSMARSTMGSNLEDLRQLLRVVGPGASALRRARLLLAALADPGAGGLLEAHCEVAASLARDMGLPDSVTAALAVAYARWDGRGVPADVGGTEIPRALRIAVVARDIELWARDTDIGATEGMLSDRRGKAYDPEVVDAALDAGIVELRRLDGDLWEAVMALEPAPVVAVTDAAVDDVLRALGDFADLKHPSQSGHHRRVEQIVGHAADARGLAWPEARRARQAAMVHDVGIVALPAASLADASTTSPSWIEQMRMHPMWGERLLSRCAELRPVATVVGRHHERIDGSGYPAGHANGHDDATSLLVCAELYDELVAAKGGDPDEARRSARDELIRLGEAGALDRVAVRAVIEGLGERAPLIDVERPAGLTEREIEVLGLLARGNTDRGIAEALGISVKTVGAHVEHIYAKVNVSTRAAATLFAAQHDLV